MKEAAEYGEEVSGPQGEGTVQQMDATRQELKKYQEGVSPWR